MDKEGSSGAYSGEAFPTAFGHKALPPIPQPPNAVGVIHASATSWLVTQTLEDTVRLICGIWAMIVAQHGVPDPSMYDHYPACLVPRVTCARDVNARGMRPTGVVPPVPNLHETVGECDWASGRKGCNWSHPDHSPRCTHRHVDWKAYVNTVWMWVSKHFAKNRITRKNRPAEYVNTDLKHAMSPSYITFEVVNPEAPPMPDLPKPRSDREANVRKAAHIQGGYASTATKREGSVLWAPFQARFVYADFADKKDISRLIADKKACRRMMVICDGPANKVGRVFAVNNAGELNTIAKHETIEGNLDSVVRHFAMASGAVLPTHTPPTPPRGATLPHGGEENEKVQSQLNSIAEEEKEDGDSIQPRAEARDDLQTYADSLVAERVPQMDEHHILTNPFRLIIVPPHMLTLDAFLSDYNVTPTVLSRAEARQLFEQAINPHTLPMLSETDPMAIRYNLNASHSNHGRVPAYFPDHEPCDLPTVIKTYNAEGHACYQRVVRDTPGNTNNMHTLVPQPDLTDAQRETLFAHSLYAM